VIKRANQVGVNYFVVPGTDLETSKKAVEIARKHEGVYAAVGIHPHNVYKLKVKSQKSKVEKELDSLSVILTPTLRRGKNLSRMRENLKRVQRSFVRLRRTQDDSELNQKVVAVGEIGLDRHIYQKTKYQDYEIDEEFFKLQKLLFIEQLKLARKFKKSVIIHNRDAKEDLLKVLNDHWDSYFSGRMVFHCCEPDFVETRHGVSLLEFAKTHNIYIGVDGDVFYNKKKQEFVKKVPLELLVLETDSPFLSPTKEFPNEPKNLLLIAEFVARLLNSSINPPSSLGYRSGLQRVSQLIKITTENAERLFLK